MTEQIDLEWRDAVGKGHYTTSEGEKPRSILLRGTVWLVEENETDLVVAAYIADDGGYVDMCAIPKKAIEKRNRLLASLA